MNSFPLRLLLVMTIILSHQTSTVDAWAPFSSSLQLTTTTTTSTQLGFSATNSFHSRYCRGRRSGICYAQSSSGTKAAKDSPSKTNRQALMLFPWANKDQTEELGALSKNNNNNQSYMKNEIKVLERDEDFRSPELVGAGAVAASVLLAAGYYTSNYLDISADNIVDFVQAVANDPSATLDQVVQNVADMGPLGPLYFGIAYTLAEILAIPAIPLTASAGYLFGPIQGTGVVLLSASIAAAISFQIGRTFLRNYVEKVLEDYPDFAKIDRAIGKEGFKLMLLLRLSPIFPFALSNYLYGASSISFSNFFWGTLLGFAPGTLAYVYTGYAGKALTTDGADAYPWFVYVGGLALFGGLLKVIADTATKTIEELEDEDLS